MKVKLFKIKQSRKRDIFRMQRNKNLEYLFEEECKVFAENIEQERHKDVNMLPIYKQIEEDICNRYNVTRNYLKSKVLEYQLDIYLKNDNYKR